MHGKVHEMIYTLYLFIHYILHTMILHALYFAYYTWLYTIFCTLCLFIHYILHTFIVYRLYFVQYDWFLIHRRCPSFLCHYNLLKVKLRYKNDWNFSIALEPQICSSILGQTRQQTLWKYWQIIIVNCILYGRGHNFCPWSYYTSSTVLRRFWV